MWIRNGWKQNLIQLEGKSEKREKQYIYIFFFSFFLQQDCEYDSLALSSKMGSGEVRKHGLFCGSRLVKSEKSEK